MAIIKLVFKELIPKFMTFTRIFMLYFSAFTSIHRLQLVKQPLDGKSLLGDNLMLV